MRTLQRNYERAGYQFKVWEVLGRKTYAIKDLAMEYYSWLLEHGDVQVTLQVFDVDGTLIVPTYVRRKRQYTQTSDLEHPEVRLSRYEAEIRRLQVKLAVATRPTLWQRFVRWLDTDAQAPNYTSVGMM
ncbi:hypothetical protein NKDENANG_02306 [Candidatus Entotheonellaceae bacterium PAL068K]